jgi:carbon storage regulator
MLVLARRTAESLQIGPDITITVLGIHGNQVRLGITAPRTIVIDRAEIHARKQREYIGAADDHAVSAKTVTVSTR